MATAAVDDVRVKAKEIVAEDERDAEQEACVEGRFGEDFVCVGAIHAETAGEPCHGAPLPFEFLMDKPANVYHSPYEKRKRMRTAHVYPSLRYRQVT